MIQFTISKKITCDREKNPVKVNYYITVGFQRHITFFCKTLPEVKQLYTTMMRDINEAISKPEKYVIYFQELQPNYNHSSFLIPSHDQLDKKKDEAFEKRNWKDYNNITRELWTEKMLPASAKTIGVDVLDKIPLMEVTYKEILAYETEQIKNNLNAMLISVNTQQYKQEKVWEMTKEELCRVSINKLYSKMKDFDLFTWIETSLK